MSPNEIERALRDDRTIAPSPEFAGRVMRVVRQRADEREALAFPWRRLAPGLALCAAIVAVGLVGGAPPLRVESTLAQAVTWIPSVLAGSYALVWWSLRLAGFRR